MEGMGTIVKRVGNAELRQAHIPRPLDFARREVERERIHMHGWINNIQNTFRRAYG